VSVPAHQERFAFEGSQCEERSPGNFPPLIRCVAAFRDMPRTMIALDAPGGPETVAQAGTWSYAAYPLPLDMDPIVTTVLPILPLPNTPANLRALWERPDTRMILTPMRPVAHFRRDLEFAGVRLADYALPPPRAELRVF
jgi:hypothetical protein